MEFEKEIFARCKIDFIRLIEYGFQKVDENYIYTKPFLENQFEAVITVSKEGTVVGKVIDRETGEIYSLLRNEKVQGSFIGQVREEYQAILIDIFASCTIKTLFLFEQTNRMVQYLLQKYQSNPEFLWKDTPNCCVFRNQKTKKWYGIIMNLDYSKIEESRSEMIEVINVKVNRESVPTLIEKPGIYQAYHMNKKYWITIVLDDTVKDEEIYELLDVSYNLVDK